MQPILYVGNRNYSSWSLRPWLVLRWGGIDFETRAINLEGPGFGQKQLTEVVAVNPAGTVPVLHVQGEVIGDSLAIAEWAAEQQRSLWPAEPLARARARAAACEVHSGFASLRSSMPCNIRRRAPARELGPDVLRDVDRVQALWTTLRQRFSGGGPYLFGDLPTIADAFFTPVATRFRTYSVKLSPDAQAYAEVLLANPAFREWERAAIEEPWTMPRYETA